MTPVSADAGQAFCGWHMVVAAHVLFGLAFGSMYAFGVFLEHIQNSFQVGRFSVSAIFSGTALVYYLLGWFAGALADRFSVRRIVATGVALLALGFVLGSQASSLGGLLLSFCLLVGVGIALIYVPAIAVVQRWFVRQRSRASGLALAGTGVGTFLGPVAAGLLLQHLSWRDTMQWFALVIVVLGLGAAAVLVGQPADLGQWPDGDTQAREAVGAGAAGLSLREALARPVFWWYFLSIFLASIGLFTALVHIHPSARAAGVAPEQGAWLIGLIGVGNVLGRLLLSGLGDRLGVQRLLHVLTLGLALLPCLWWQADAFWGLALFALLFGAAHGGCIALYPAVTADWFGTRHLGAVLGALYTSVGLAALLGASVAGWVFDLTHSYTWPILGSAVAALLAAGCLGMARRSASPHRLFLQQP
jgi:OFA family oxalate/formate antiporter-like MFS transporter